MAGAGGRSGAERYKATCHPRLGGACEANGFVRVAQAGVAGAALARDGKAGATARHAARKASRARTGTRARRPNKVRRLIQEDCHGAGSVDPDAEAGVERSGGRAEARRRGNRGA